MSSTLPTYVADLFPNRATDERPHEREHMVLQNIVRLGGSVFVIWHDPTLLDAQGGAE